jgi:hypothetical protein
MRSSLVGALLFPCVVAATAHAQSAPPPKDRWQLLAREGECAEIASLRRRFADLPAVSEPEQFLAFVRSRGLGATASNLAVPPPGKAVRVEVPERGLDLVFVTEGLCSTTIKRAR